MKILNMLNRPFIKLKRLSGKERKENKVYVNTAKLTLNDQKNYN